MTIYEEDSTINEEKNNIKEREFNKEINKSEKIMEKKDKIVIKRYFTKEGENPLEQISWESSRIQIYGQNNKLIFNHYVEHPDFWDEMAVRICADKYFKTSDLKNHPRGGERSIRDIIHRVAYAISERGYKLGYFDEKSKEILYDEICYLTVNQFAAFNSPVWFNWGLYDAYEFKGNSKAPRWAIKNKDEKVYQQSFEYENSQGSACKSADTIITTENGPMTIENVVNIISEGKNIKVLTSKGFSIVKAGKNNGIKTTYAITFKDGNVLRITGNDEMFSSSKGKHYKANWKLVELLGLEYNRNKNKFKLDEHCIHSNLIDSYSLKEKENNNLSISKSIIYGQMQTGGYFETLKDLNPNFSNLIAINNELNLKKYKTGVPESIKFGSRKIVIAYLQSVFQVDGRIIKKENFCKVQFGTINKKLSYDIFHMLRNLGIFSQIKKNVNLKENKKNGWIIDIQNYSEIKKFKEIIGFIGKTKKEKLDKWINDSRENKKVEDFWSPIESVEIFGKEEVFDIETGAHDFYANGVLVHNCYITQIDDELVNGETGIYDWIQTEMSIFANGSGSGANVSRIRGENEPITGGGKSSGLLSFLKVADQSAAAIKSGGKCLPGYQHVYTETGPVQVKDLVDKSFICLSFDPPEERFKAKKAHCWKSGKKEIYRITTDKGCFNLSFDHPVRLSDGQIIKTKDLKKGMSLFNCSISISETYPRISLKDGKKGKIHLHRLIAQDIMNEDIKNLAIHHKDGNKFNNNPNNLEIMYQSDHASLHNKILVENDEHYFQLNKFDTSGEKNGMHKNRDFWKNEGKVKKLKSKLSYFMKSGHAKKMQKSASKKRMINLAYKLINSGYDIDNFDKYLNARIEKFGNVDSSKRVLKSIEDNFGNYESFKKELSKSNHRIMKIESIGFDDVYSVEVECQTPDDKTSESGHNFVIWSNNDHSGSGIVVLNTRRAAKMLILDDNHPDLMNFIGWKKREEDKARALILTGYQCDWNSSEENSAYKSVQAQNANNSIRISDALLNAIKEDEDWEIKWTKSKKTKEKIKARKVFEEIVDAAWECGDPGLFYKDNVEKWNTIPNTGEIRSSNPCVTGETLIATADGRNYVSIKQLTEEGLDVPVYSYNKEKNITEIKWGRNPRKTGINKKILKVTLDDDSIIRCTENHKFLLRNGEEKEAKNLSYGDSLVPFNKWQTIPKKTIGIMTPYWMISQTTGNVRSEHKLIKEFDIGHSIKEGYCIHHKDYNSLNNSLNNLEYLTFSEHSRIHALDYNSNPMQGGWWNDASEEEKNQYKKKMSESTSGNKNGRYINADNQEILKYAKKLIISLQRSFTSNEWAKYAKENNLPSYLSLFRKKELDSILTVSRNIALELNLPAIQIHHLSQFLDNLKKYKFAEESGAYISVRHEGNYYPIVTKKCEECGNNFEIQWPSREQSYCSQKCSGLALSIKLFGKPASQKRLDIEEVRKENVRNQQVNIFNSLKLNIEKVPQKKEWVRECKINNVSAEISRPTSPFRTYKDLKEAASLINHRIKLVESDGYEDVYNITVDDNHTFSIITKTCHTRTFMPKLSGINVSNCGEFLQPDNSSCNLASFNLIRFLKEDKSFDIESFEAAIKIFTMAMEVIVSGSSYPSKRIADMTRKTRPLGLGYCNIGGLIMSLGYPYDSEHARSIIGSITSLESAVAYNMSSYISSFVGPFLEYEKNKESMLKVINMHRDANKNINPKIKFSKQIQIRAEEQWDQAYKNGRKFGFRNSQVVVIAPTGCITEDSMILTDQGILPIVDLGDKSGNQWQNIDFNIFQEKEIKKSDKFYINGLSPVFKIITERGHSIKSTGKHQFRIIDQSGNYVWKRADLICEQDTMVLSLGGHCKLLEKKVLIELNNLESKNSFNNNLNFPNILKNDTAEILGYYMGNGYLEKEESFNLIISNKDSDLYDHFEKWIKLIGINDNNKKQKNNKFILCAYSKKLVEWFNSNEFSKSKSIYKKEVVDAFIPQKVLQSRTSIVCSFLRGLFESNGCISITGKTSYPLIKYSTESKKLIYEVFYLLESLGIQASLREKTKLNNKTRYIIKLLDIKAIKKYKELIGFISIRKNNILNSIVFENIISKGNKINHKVLIRDFYDRARKLNLSHNICLDIKSKINKGNMNLDWVIKVINNNPGLKSSKIGKILNLGNIQLVNIKSNNYFGMEQTYDISVPENNTYITNGFISHNTIMFLMGTNINGIEPSFALTQRKLMSDGSAVEFVCSEINTALNRLNYSKIEIENISKYLIDNGHIENCPDLKAEHIPVFDTANISGNGSRYIRPMAHVEAVAAATPFVSGGISKTINLPEDATRDDIYECYMKGWELGCKALSLYRDGSKWSQPLSSNLENLSRNEIKKYENEGKKIYQRIGEFSGDKKELIHLSHKNLLTRRKASDFAMSERYNFRLSGERYTIFVVRHEDGRIAEVWLELGNEGETVKGLAATLGRILSVAIQYGVPISALCETMRDQQYEPRGFLGPNELGIRSGQSIADLTSKVLDKLVERNGDYIKKEKSFKKNTNNNININDNSIISNADEAKKAGYSGIRCPECGSFETQGNIKCGTCLSCNHAYGSCS